MHSAFVIAVLGAESTGKTTLAEALTQALRELTGESAAFVPETLRLWCDAQGRTPRPDEQPQIALAQQQAIETAAQQHRIVVADTTSVMTALYSQHLFADTSLIEPALAWHRSHVDVTLLMALDLPWIADGIQRDGPHVRAPIDAELRALLHAGGIGYGVVTGSGPHRLARALDALARPLALRLMGDCSPESIDRADAPAPAPVPWANAKPSAPTAAPIVASQATTAAAVPVSAAPGPDRPRGSRLLSRLLERDQAFDRPWNCEGCDDPLCEAQARRGRA